MSTGRSAKRALTSRLPRPLFAAQLARRRRPLWEKAGIVFIHVPRNGGTSIELALYGRFMGHLTVREVARWAPGALARLPSFALTRNPWARALSAYRFAVAGQGDDRLPEVAITHPERYRTAPFRTFERFVLEWLPSRDLASEDHVFRAQGDFLLGSDGSVGVSHLGRLEDLGETVRYLEDTLRRRIEVPRANATGRPGSYREAYTPEMRDAVASVYAEDIARFGYAF